MAQVDAISSTQNDKLLDAFIEGTIAPQDFTHRDHVAVAYELLRRESFVRSAVIFVDGLKKLVAAAGVPEKFNLTITLAYLGLIAERLADDKSNSWGAFAQDNPELLDPKILQRWYAPDRLYSETARQVFLLPTAPDSLQINALQEQLVS